MRCIPILAGAAALGVLAVPATAVADAATYDYVEARYTLLGDIEVGSGDEDATGLGLEASRTFSDNLFARIRTDMYSVDVRGSGDAAVDFFSVGPGIFVELNTPGTVTLWGQFNYERLGYLGGVGTGFGFEAGIRGQVTERVDVGFAVKSADTDAGSRDIAYDTWELEGAYALNRDIDLTASLVNGEIDPDGARSSDIDNLVRIGIRVPF